ncbi:hypothetical protein [Alicyclobacillus shizuokensis]|uniref:hypothetical protein n=1 Tax=Alicyclobacillus shizuokensis TaxID=392014 RepID=UPI0008366433|nr:hypothetical protein [Alicyclobacillus shizuokensis]
MDVEALKQKYEEVYQTQILDQVFIIRPLSRQEYKEILEADLPLGQHQEAICKVGVIYPSDFDFENGLAGYAEALSDMILDISTLKPDQGKQLLEQYRSEMANFDYQVDCIITEAFPQFTLEELQTWTVKKTMLYLSRAEWKLAMLRGVPLVQVPEGDAPPPNTPSPSPSSENPPKQGPLSKEEVEAMLSQAMGKPISLDQETRIGQPLPEFSWFRAEAELKGEFD